MVCDSFSYLQLYKRLRGTFDREKKMWVLPFSAYKVCHSFIVPLAQPDCIAQTLQRDAAALKITGLVIDPIPDAALALIESESSKKFREVANVRQVIVFVSGELKPIDPWPDHRHFCREYGAEARQQAQPPLPRKADAVPTRGVNFQANRPFLSAHFRFFQGAVCDSAERPHFACG